MIEGLLLVNKPVGVTSHDVVQVVRRQLGMRRVGHTGILDPMAEGLLVLVIGRATRYQHELQCHDKLYEGVLTLGARTDTADATGQVIETASIPSLTDSKIEEALVSFRGRLSQTPPAYSAVKVHGRPAYWWTRRNKAVNLNPRLVHIYDIGLIRSEGDTVAFHLHCSAGTYIRTLAESISERLGTVGHLSTLIRKRIGRWSLEDAQSLSDISKATPPMLARFMLPVTAANARS